MAAELSDPYVLINLLKHPKVQKNEDILSVS